VNELDVSLLCYTDKATVSVETCSDYVLVCAIRNSEKDWYLPIFFTPVFCF
jgi:hypothetical protein